MKFQPHQPSARIPYDDLGIGLTVGHHHAIEALAGLDDMLAGVTSAYRRPFQLSFNLIEPDQALVREADACFRRGVALLKESIRRGVR